MASKPIKDFRYGSVRVAVWENQTKAGIMYNVSVCRPYLNKAKEWAESHSFSDYDLPNLAKAVNDAHSWIYELKQHAQVIILGHDETHPEQNEPEDLLPAAA